MNCQGYSESMMKYFDKNINDIESAQLKQHLKTCKQCNEEFEEMSSVLSFLEMEKSIEPPQDFEEKVMTRVRLIEPEWRKVSDKTIRFLYGFSIFMLILLMCMFTINIFGEKITESLSALNSVSDLFETIKNALVAIGSVVGELILTIFRMALVISKAYYYVIILIAVMLFAIQWSFMSLLKQNQGGQVR